MSLDWHEAAAHDGYHAVTGWSTDDVRAIREDWDEEKALAFLMKYEDAIVSAMVDAGWYAIHTYVDEEE